MKSLPIGAIGLTAIFYYLGYKESASLYINAHALLIVVFGTACILFLSNPSSSLVHSGKRMIELFSPEKDLQVYTQELIELSKSKNTVISSKHPLIAHAAELWGMGLSQETIHILVSQKRNLLEGQDIELIQSVRNLAKYPPALGMLGTVMGLVGLFSELGNADNRSMIGPSLAVALTSTFYGLILANAILLPMADRLHTTFLHRRNKSNLVYDVLILINRGEPPLVIAEELKLSDAA